MNWIALIALLVTMIVAVQGQKTWDILNQFPVVHGFPPKKWNNLALEWQYIGLELIKTSGYRSTPGSLANLYLRGISLSGRAGAILSDCMYDAWVATSGTHDLPVSGKKIKPKFNPKSKDVLEAIAYAAYTASYFNFGFLGDNFTKVINDSLVNQKYNLNLVNDNSTHLASGVGVLACQYITSQALLDGTNQNGSNPYGTPPNQFFSDYTNYHPQNVGMPVIGHTDCSTLQYIDSWQPARVRNTIGSDSSSIRGWFDSVIANTKPFSMTFPGQFRPGPVPKNQSTTYDAWIARNKYVVDKSASLGDYEKAQAVYFQGSEGYSNTLYSRFRVGAAQKADLNLEKTIKLNLLVSHAETDAAIAQYDGKRFYNAPRTTTPIQCIYKDQTINSWRGPYLGTGTINGSNWRALLPDTQVMNPTPEYPCGHCTLSGSANVAFQRFFGNDKFQGYDVTFLPGTFLQEPKLTSEYIGYQQGLTDIPNTGMNTKGYAPAKNVTLHWDKWSEVTKKCSLSRILLGVHYPDSEEVGYALGQKVGNHVADKIFNTLWVDKRPRINDEPAIEIPVIEIPVITA